MKTMTNTANWLFLVFGAAAAVIHQTVRPITWRRTVRAEFWRYMDMVCIGNLPSMLTAAILVGLTLVSQALFWVDRFGQSDAIGDVILFIVVRELAPLIVGLLTLGSGGIVLLGELSAMRASGELDALDRQGVDPFLLLVVPRVAALVVSVFVHTLVFTVVAFTAGYSLAQATGASVEPPAQFVINVLTSIGASGYLVLPIKSLAIGLTIGVVCSLTAMDRDMAGLARERLTAKGFIRAISGILLVSALLSAAI